MSDEKPKKSKKSSKSEAPGGNSGNMSQHTSKQKKGKDSETEESHVQISNLAITKTKKKKSSREAIPDDPPVPLRDIEVEVPDAPRKKKRVREEARETSDKTTSHETGDVKEKKKKRKHQTIDEEEVETSAPEPQEDAPPPEEKKSKKRKKSRKENLETTLEQVPEVTQTKKKTRCDHTDPSQDKSLADQNLKALSFAYERFQNPESWKFNKARQNWLIRNIWSDQAIPEKYLHLATMYLADIKGGVRQKLIDTCNSKITPDATAPTEDARDTEAQANSNADKSPATGNSDASRSRAHLLLAALAESN
ncbi:hypothetical protein HYDPIDRAFT_23468 [Hydnomerulius pinastri MD-312]|nr:hypothetical protein HYDPIDRAFT_23468 [Hydnomerulius pinastri MD-312]